MIAMPLEMPPATAQKPGRSWVTLQGLQQFLDDVLDYAPSERTVIQWRQRGCPHLPISDRCIRYSPEEVLEWLKETRQVQKPPTRHNANPRGSSRKPTSKDSREEILAKLQAVASQGRR